MKKLVSVLLVAALVASLCVISASAESVKIGFVALHDENSTYDLNFLNAFKAACENCGVEAVIKTNKPESEEAYDAAAELADDGCALVIADSYGHQPYILQAAEEFPDVEFVSCTGDMAQSAELENYHNAFASIFQGRFLAGVAAGLKLNEMIANGEFTAEEAKLGYIGAMTYAEVKSGYTSFYLGAKSVCPTVTMDVVFTGSWYDETLEKEGAEKLIANGCKIISQHADSMGAPTACESAGVPNVSYNGSTLAACPNTFIVSSRIDWTPYFEMIINAVLAGESFDIDWCGNLETGSVTLTDVNENVAAAGTVEKMAEVEAALRDGSLHVFDCSTWTVNGETLTSYDQVAYYEGHECIWDGYFHESETRSAPYFDIDIDGINLL